MAQAQIGLIGLAVMGQNLALNIHDHGYVITVFNRSEQKTRDFMAGSAKDSKIIASYSLKEFVGNLSSPRKIIMMVKAGEPVDKLIEQLKPLLDEGDILIDGGNSLYTDTQRRVDALKQDHLLYLGTGISGGEEGARNGPSIMPGGNADAWDSVKDILQSISAKTEEGADCCAWVGDGGAGHYVKMVHNGIEYGDMQIICEAYQLLREGLGLDVARIQQLFEEWNQGELNSYLIEITANILKVEENGKPLVDVILDTAGQKGTGKWTAINALELGMPLSLISESVFMRCLSSLKDQRVQASKRFNLSSPEFAGDVEASIASIRQAVYAAKIISYTQGFMLMQQAAVEYGWKLEYANIAQLWRGGCIIRSQFLGEITRAYENNPALDSLLMDDFFHDAIKNATSGWKQTCILGIEQGIPAPAINSALNFYHAYCSETLPANLLQAQRDYFGAHTYERVDQDRGQFFHTEWLDMGDE